jgi:hypothetical protein
MLLDSIKLIHFIVVIPAQAGTQLFRCFGEVKLVSRLRGNDGLNGDWARREGI